MGPNHGRHGPMAHKMAHKGAELAQQLPRWLVEDGIAAYEEGQLCQVLSGGEKLG